MLTKISTRSVLLTILCLGGLSDGADAQPSNTKLKALSNYQSQHQELHATFAQKLETLARACDEKGLRIAAVAVRDAATPFNTRVLSSHQLPDELQKPIPLSLPPEERLWRTHLRSAQQEHATKLYILSQKMLRSSFASHAYQLVREAAHHDPDHKAARRLLGYVPFENRWVTPYAHRQLSRGNIWHKEFGWISRRDVDRYERGERKWNNRWISKEREAEIRRDFNNAWTIRTEHYLVKTNHSLEKGVQIAEALEEYYGFFFQVFAGFFNTPAQMQKLFASGTRTTPTKPYEVHYYASQEEYNARLIKKIPQIAQTNGLYFTTDRTAYFFFNPKNEDDLSVVYHEATHQLFYESEGRHRSIAAKENFWIVEGIACYMESFQKKDGQVSLGDPTYIRFDAARYRLLKDRYYIKLADLSSWGLVEFQSHKNISRNYSQSSGLAHFFMHYDQGRYRDALIEHLSQIYHQNPRRPTQPASLAKLTGVPYETLDQQYIEYMKQQAIRLGE